MRAGTKRRWKLFAKSVGLVTLLAAIWGSAIVSTGGYFPRHSLGGAMVGALSGGFAGLIYAAVIAGVEIFLPRSALGRTLERAPLLVTLAAKAILYGGVMFAVVGTKMDRWFGTFIVFGADAASKARAADVFPVIASIMIMVIVAAITVFAIQVIGLIGGGTFRDVALGRYRRSRIEERFFLFVDIVGSTPLAERLGPDSVHRFLDRVFQIASDPIDDHAGEVYQYVGDEVVITWLVADGRVAARPLACHFSIEAALREAAGEFEREFGTVPKLRAALHAGQVITGRVGGTRRAIVFHGDVMNTTSRIENMTRDLNVPFLVSADALERLDGVRCPLVDLGLQPLRGRTEPVRLYAVGNPQG